MPVNSKLTECCSQTIGWLVLISDFARILYLHKNIAADLNPILILVE